MKSTIKKVFTWIKEHLWLFKLVFIASVLFFVVNQLTNILQGMTWDKFLHLILHQGLLSIVLMAIVGMLAALPMILYDVATTKTLGLQLPPMQLVKDGWIINTINNLVGFGGVVGVTLRMNRYGKEKKGAQTLATITKTALFMLTGLSLLCLLTLIVVFVVPQEAQYQSYKWWLIGGSLFAPLLGLVIALKKNFFKEFSRRHLALFYLASFGQWTGALVIFLFIGYQVVQKTTIIHIAPLFVVATLIGMLTMVPGGIGTFDVLMILGLSHLGINKEVALVWLLFYRLFYYVVPFISGILLFLHQAGNRFNKALNKWPSVLLSKGAHLFLTMILYASGLTMIVLSTLPNLSMLSHFFNWLLPFSFNFFDQTLNMMMGLLLIGLARGVYQRVRYAYGATVIVLLICLVNTIITVRSWQLILLFTVTLLVIYWSRKEFTRQRLVYSWGALLMDGLLFVGLAIFYGLVGYFVNTRHQFNNPSFILFPSEKIWLQGAIGLIIAFVLIISLYYYLSRDKKVGEAYDASRFQAFVQRYGDTSLTHLGYGGSYRFYYYQVDGQDEVAFMFKVIANHCVVLGNPMGQKVHFKAAVEAFKTDIARYNYQAVFYNISHEYSVMLHDLGYEFMKIGEEGYHRKGTGAQNEVSSHTQWLTPEERTKALPRLESLSRDFESLHRPLYFNRAYYSKAMIEHSEVIVYRDQQDIVGYAVLSQANHHTMTLMYLHYTDEQMIRPFIADIQSLLEQHQCSLSLGLSPLSNVGTSDFAFREEKMINLLYSIGNQMSYLERINHAMTPYVNHWESRYMSYPRHQSFNFLLLQVVVLMIQKPK